MGIPTTNIKWSSLQTEFGGTSPIGLSEYYRGGPLVPSNDFTVGIPVGGVPSPTINAGAFANKAKGAQRAELTAADGGTQNLTLSKDLGVNTVVIDMVGGGGAGRVRFASAPAHKSGSAGSSGRVTISNLAQLINQSPDNSVILELTQGSRTYYVSETYLSNGTGSLPVGSYVQTATTSSGGIPGNKTGKNTIVKLIVSGVVRLEIRADGGWSSPAYASGSYQATNNPPDNSGNLVVVNDGSSVGLSVTITNGGGTLANATGIGYVGAARASTLRPGVPRYQPVSNGAYGNGGSAGRYDPDNILVTITNNTEGGTWYDSRNGAPYGGIVVENINGQPSKPYNNNSYRMWAQEGFQGYIRVFY